MLDNQLFTLLGNILTNGLAALQLSNVGVRQNYNPVQVGTPTGPTVFIYKIGDYRRGTPQAFSKYSAGAAAFTGTIAGNVLTVSAKASGTIELNQAVAGAGVAAGTIIQGFQSGTGGTGTYLLNLASTVASPEAMTSGPAEVRVTNQVYETTFQFSALSTQDPANPNQLTASDIMNYVAFIMQNPDTTAQLQGNSVGVLKVGQVRNPYFTDDRQRYEASPNFEMTLTHNQIILTSPPILSGETFNIYPV